MEKWWEMHHPTTICGLWGKFRTKNPIVANKQQPMCHPIRTPAGVCSAGWQSPGQRGTGRGGWGLELPVRLCSSWWLVPITWLLFGERLRDYITVVRVTRKILIIQIRIGLFQSQSAWWWGFIIPNDCFMTKLCSWQSCIHTVQRAHPALRKLWDGGGRFKNSCHGSTKSSTQANETVCHCFDSRLQHLVHNGISTGIQKVIDATRLLALVWWSCVYTYQTLKMRFNMQLLVACVAWQNPTINQSINHSGNPSLKKLITCYALLGKPSSCWRSFIIVIKITPH